jgi:hypothetical protein
MKKRQSVKLVEEKHIPDNANANAKIHRLAKRVKK